MLVVAMVVVLVVVGGGCGGCRDCGGDNSLGPLVINSGELKCSNMFTLISAPMASMDFVINISWHNRRYMCIL